MAKFKVIVSDPQAGTSKVVEIEESRAAPFIGRRLGEIIDGGISHFSVAVQDRLLDLIWG